MSGFSTSLRSVEGRRQKIKAADLASDSFFDVRATLGWREPFFDPFVDGLLAYIAGGSEPGDRDQV